MVHKANKIIAAVIALVAIAALVALAWPRSGGGDDMRVLVHDGDGEVHELQLDRDSETTITTSLGTNVVVVEGGAVFVRDADCGNHDCIRQGRIDAPGHQIICLPHRLWIEVVGGNDAGGSMNPDAVASAGELDVTSR